MLGKPGEEHTDEIGDGRGGNANQERLDPGPPPGRPGDQYLPSEPMAKKVKPIIAVKVQIEAGAPAMNGRSGIEPPTMKAKKVMIAALAGEREIGGSPCSSVKALESAVAQMADMRPLLEPHGDGARPVAMLEMPGDPCRRSLPRS